MNRHQRAIFFIISSAFFFALMNFGVRAAGALPTMQKAFFRNAVAFAVSGAMVARQRIFFRFNRQQGTAMLLRAVAGTVGIAGNFYAVDHLNLADASMLGKLAPFFAVLLSAAVLGEALRKWDIAILAAAFCGALFVVKPSFSAAALPAFVGVLGGLGAGCAFTYLRKLCRLGVPGSVIIMCFSALSCIFFAPFLATSHLPMTGRQFLCLLLTGGCAAAAQFCVTTAYRLAPASEIAVFDYSQVLFSALLGFFFLDQIPDLYSFIGYAIIVGAAVVKWRYSRQDGEADRNETT